MTEEKDIKAVTGGRLIDGSGREPVDNATVIIEGSKIQAAGKDVTVPRGAEVIDATGKTVMPGLIDAHVHHYGFKNSWMEPSRSQELTLIKSIDDSRRMLASGFTMVRDCGGKNAPVLKKAVAEGTLTGLPRILAAHFLLCQTGGELDNNPNVPSGSRDARVSSGEALVCDGVDGCIKATRYALRQGADFIKTFISGGFATEYSASTDVQFNMDELKAIVRTATQAGKYVTAHSQNAQSTRNGILAGLKTIEHVSRSDDEVIELAMKHGTIFVSTLAYIWYVAEGKMIVPLQMQARFKTEWEAEVSAYRKIRKMGATLAAGTDCSGHSREKNALELELLVKYCDFTPMEAIVAATKNGAMACYMGDKTGTIQPGKLADIIIVDGDPLADIGILQDEEKIKMVMLEGKIEVNRGLVVAGE